MSTMRIDGRLIGPGHRTLVIAEIGVNHDGSMTRAMELIHHAAAAGADAVKFQIFRAQTLVHESSTLAAYQAERVDCESSDEMLRKYELDDAQLETLIGLVKSLGMMPLATPFSVEDVERIAKFNLPAIKIASPDLVNLPLLTATAKLGLPMLISTGAATMDEVASTVYEMNRLNVDGVLLHCVSSYPTPAEQANLCWMSELAAFGWPVGYSDHTTEPLAGALAIASGACVIEKHLTYDRNAEGPDHSASADPQQFAAYVRAIRSAEAMRGVSGKRVLPIERDVRSGSRQSLVLRRDLAAGEMVTDNDLRVQRPGSGIGAAHFMKVVGRAAVGPLRKGTLLQWEMLSEAA